MHAASQAVAEVSTSWSMSSATYETPSTHWNELSGHVILGGGDGGARASSIASGGLCG